jgi:hypothetical protein
MPNQTHKKNIIQINTLTNISYKSRLKFRISEKIAQEMS